MIASWQWAPTACKPGQVFWTKNTAVSTLCGVLSHLEVIYLENFTKKTWNIFMIKKRAHIFPAQYFREEGSDILSGFSFFI